VSVETIIEGVLEREKGYANNPKDAGGETMWGITIATARHHGYLGLMRELTRDQAARIYLAEYVTQPGFDKVVAMNAAIGEELVDSGVNCGPGLPGVWLQRTLNLLNREARLFPDLVVDGALGPATLAALKTVLGQRGADGARVILRALNCLQGARYFDITEKRAANEEFFFGWMLNRVEIK
jgi:lysozyme family protein